LYSQNIRSLSRTGDGHRLWLTLGRSRDMSVILTFLW
jgi:hypothetical protein